MKHWIPPLFAVLVIVNGWGEEWIFASGITMSNCNALASELQGELAEGERADCRGVGLVSSPGTFPDFASAIQAGANARATIDRNRRANELHQKKLDAFPDFTFK